AWEPALYLLAPRIRMAKGEVRAAVEGERVGGVDHHLAREILDVRELDRMLGAAPQGRQHDDLAEGGGLGERPRRGLRAGRLRPVLQLPRIAGADLHLMPEAGEPRPERLADIA